MFQVKLRYLDIYVSNSFQRFSIPHVIWICVRAMFCDKKFHEHFNVLDVILVPILPRAGWRTETGQFGQREGHKSHLTRSLNIPKCRICHSLDREGNKSKCQKSNLKSDSFLPMFDITRIHTMNTLRWQLIKVWYLPYSNTSLKTSDI